MGRWPFALVSTVARVVTWSSSPSRYLEQTKAMYKDLLTVHKKASTGKVEVTSRVFQVSLAPAAAAKGQGAPLFPGGVPDHSRCFVVVDPVRRYATAVYSNYKSFW